MEEVASPILDPDAFVGTGAYVVATPKMELGSMLALTSSPDVVDYAFYEPIVEPGWGFTSELLYRPIFFGTQEVTAEFFERVVSSVGRVKEALASQLADRLESEAQGFSVARRAARSPSFKRLAQLGPIATSTALRRLAGRSRPLWLFFLQRTSGVRPAVTTLTVDEAAAAWRAWGEERGLV